MTKLNKLNTSHQYDVHNIQYEHHIDEMYLINCLLKPKHFLAVTATLDGCAVAPATQICSRSAEACVGPRLTCVKIEFDSL